MRTNGASQQFELFVKTMLDGLRSSVVFTAVPRALLGDVSKEAKNLHRRVQPVLPSCLCIAIAGEGDKWQLALTLNPKHAHYKTDVAISNRGRPIVAELAPDKIAFVSEDVLQATYGMERSDNATVSSQAR
jgi:hypothetical protein